MKLSVVNSVKKCFSFIKRRRKLVLIVLPIVCLFVWWLFCLPEDLFENTPYSTVVTDKNGELIGARVADDGQWRFPPCDTLPEKFVRALIEFEDCSFYSHFGVSPSALARAVVQNVRNGRVVSGGSTISMQVIRLSNPQPRNLYQKILEIFKAMRLEARYSKEEILRMYASHAPFGGNVVGINAAMWRYLGKEDAELSWAEAATLAVMQNCPSKITVSKNRDLLLQKRNRLLRRLCEKGVITEEEYSWAYDEPLIMMPESLPQHAPHLVENYCRSAHGLRTCTAIDLSLQKRVEDLLTKWNREFRLSGVSDMAAIIIDVHSGEPVAYCGNADMEYDREGKCVDIVRASRSSGSILKPVLYAAAMSNGTILPHTLLPDVPMDFGGFAPKNFDGTYLGAVSADVALALSLNVPNVHLLKEYGVMNFADLLKRSGFTSLTRPADKYGLSLILGGAEVTLRDVAMCYAKMSAVCCDSTAYRDFPLRDRVSLYYMFEAMYSVNRPDQIDLSRVSSVQNVAWKTGTSYGSRDAWAVGVTPNFVVGVWVGNADGSGVSGLTGAKFAGPVMFELFGLLRGCGSFEMPSEKECIMMNVCSQSGYPAGKNCSKTEVLLVPKGAKNSKVCPYCREESVSLDGNYRITDRSELVVKQNFFVLPPLMEHYYKPLHPEYVSLPPLKSYYATTSGAQMHFISPANGSIISLARHADGTPGNVICQVTHSNSSAEIFWHLDNNYLGSTTTIHEMSVSPSPGYHKITIIDNFGESLDLEIVIK